MRSPSYSKVLLLTSLGLVCQPSLHAAPVAAPEGVDLGMNAGAFIYGYDYIPVGSVYGTSWTSVAGGFAPFVAPVAQFTGVDVDGNFIPAQDLIPLRTTKTTVVAGTATRSSTSTAPPD